MGYSPRGRKESDTTERLHSLTHSLLSCRRQRFLSEQTVLITPAPETLEGSGCAGL